MTNLDDILNNIGTLKDTEEKKNKTENTGSVDSRILRFKKGCKYIGRFVPTAKDTFVTYEEIGFTSRVDQSYVYTGRAYADPALKYKGENILNKTQWEAYKAAKAAGDDAAMKETYKLFPQRKQLANFLLLEVIGDDAAAKAEIGEVKVVRYPATLDKEKNPKSAAYKAIFEGLLGAGQKKIGKKGYILPNTVNDGVNFVFDVIDKGGFPNYDQSKFDLMEEHEFEMKYTKEQVLEILNKAHDLNELVPPLKSPEEIKEILDLHWFGTSASAEDDVEVEDDNRIDTTLSDEDDEIPHLGTKSKNFDEELDELLA